MIYGNMTIDSRPNPDSLGVGICGSCLSECDEVGVDESFSDAFGLVTDWSVGSSCCGGDVFQGVIFLDKASTHTARKDHKDGKIKAGQTYRCRIRKGYYIDDEGGHIGICEYSKTKIN